MNKWRTGLALVVLGAGVTYAQGYENTTAKVKSRIGRLQFVGGYPTEATIEKAYDQLDVMRASQVYREPLRIRV